MDSLPADDRIRPVTRAVALVVIPFLLFAFAILYLNPLSTAQRWAWEIRPPLTALYMGAGYLGGAYLFLRVVVGRRWHHVAAGFPAVSIFTVAMLVATLLHRERFDPQNPAFQLWLLLYAITPVLIPWLWWRNRGADPGPRDAQETAVPPSARRIAALFAAGILGMSLVGFVYPTLLIRVWPWTLTPLTARVIAGWGALMALGTAAVARDPRWSAWRAGTESIVLWHLLFLVGSWGYRADFAGGRWLNWFTLSIIIGILFTAALYIALELRRGRGPEATRLRGAG